MPEHEHFSRCRPVTTSEHDDQAEYPADQQVDDLEQHSPSQPSACPACRQQCTSTNNRVFERYRIEAAAGLAARFAAAYTTWSYDQPPAAWLARLRPITASQLYPALAQAAWTPGILAQRDHGRQAAAGTVTGERIRGLTPGSLIITVQVRQVITTASGRSEVADDLAVTVIRAGGAQAVWDAGPAAAGNTGRGAAGALSP